MSGASAMRNAVKRITHKERSQVSERKNLGLLEKHKDYVVRAKDYHKKRDHITKLKKKANERNPDEFYFKMNSSKVVNGTHKSTKSNILDVETVKLLKSQDMGYLMHKKMKDDRTINKLKENLHFIGECKPKSHKIFVDNDETVHNFDLSNHFNTLPEFVDRTFNRPKLDQIDNMLVSNNELNPENIQLIMNQSASTYNQMKERLERSKNIKITSEKLSLQRNLMGKGKKRKIVKDDSTVVYKWKKLRNR